MTSEQIDAALSAWQARLSVAAGNLLELDDSAAYQRLRRGAALFTGRTQAKIGPVLPLIDGLWQAQSQLTDIVAQAEALRPALGKLWAHESERRRIEFLLLGESVPVAAPQTPFAKRGLLSGAEPARGMTPDALLAQMSQNFAVVKDAVVTLEAAWNRLDGALAAADKEADALQSQADTLGIGLQAELDAVRRDIAGLREQAKCDPLGADSTGVLTARLGQISASLAGAQQQRDQLDRGLRQAQALLSELGRLEPSCQALQAECRDKIAGFAEACPALPADLAGWLARVETARRNKQWKPAQVGLERWLEGANTARTAFAACCASASALLARREDLRGLLRALQAKAGAKEAHGAALDPALSGLARDAEQLLHGGPTPLDRAAALVSEYERRLAG
jgi:hypothetical protein